MSVEKINLSPNNRKLPRRLRGILIGPSGVGKTSFMKSLLRFKDQLLVEPYQKYVYCSPNINQDAFISREHELMSELKSLAAPYPMEFLPSVPSIDEIYGLVEDETTRVLLFVDDFNEDLFNSKSIAEVFCRLSSHLGVDIVCTSHTGFSKARYYTDIYRQATMIVIWKCLADAMLLVNLSKKMFPGKSQAVRDIFEVVIELLGPFAYIVITLDQGNPLDHKFMIKSRIMPFVNRFGNWEHSPLYFKPKV